MLPPKPTCHCPARRAASQESSRGCSKRPGHVPGTNHPGTTTRVVASTPRAGQSSALAPRDSGEALLERGHQAGGGADGRGHGDGEPALLGGGGGDGSDAGDGDALEPRRRVRPEQLAEAVGGAAGGEHDHVDGARVEAAQQLGAAVGRGGARLVDGDDVHLAALGAEPLGQHLAGDQGPGDEDAGAAPGERGAEVGVGEDGVGEALAAELGGDDVGADAAGEERRRRPGPDGGDARPPEGPGVAALGVELAEEVEDAVLAGEGDHVVAIERAGGGRDPRRIGRREEGDRRQLDGLGAAAAQELRGGGGLPGRPGDQDALAEERARVEPAQGAAERGHLADHDDGGAAEARRGGEAGDGVEPALHHGLLGARPPLDDRRRRRRIALPVADEAIADLGEAAHGHEDADRPPHRGELGEGELGARARGRADEGDAGGEVAVGERDPGVGRGAERRRDPGHHLEGDARRDEGLRLLRPAPEEEGIAALEPHHGAACAGRGDQRSLDRRLAGLLGGRLAAALADAAHLGALPRPVEQGRVHQLVVEHEVRRGEELGAAHGQETRVPRSAADQVDDPRLCPEEGP